MGLTGILQHGQPMFLGDDTNLVHVRRLTVEVHRNNGPRPAGDRRGQASGVEVVRLRIVIDQYGHRPHLGDRQGGGDERVGRKDHLVAGADVEGPQRQGQRVESGAHAHAVLDPAELGELLLEGAHLFTEHEGVAGQHGLDGRVDLLCQLLVLASQVDKLHLTSGGAKPRASHRVHDGFLFSFSAVLIGVGG